MDWNKTKSMFIIVFLILDIFLLVQFSGQYEASKIERLKDPSLEDRLMDLKIDYSKLNLATEPLKSQYISAKIKTFTDKDTKKLTNQDKITLDSTKTKLSASFKKREKIDSELDKVQLENFLKDFLKNNILFGDQYQFWKYDKENGIISFYQTYEKKMFYKNESGQVQLYLNDKNEIVSYEQSLLEKIEKRSEKPIYPVISAIGNLYDKKMLLENSTIVSCDLGYYTLIQPTTTQMLVPTWHFVVEHNGVQDNLYVNAIGGRVIPKSDKENEQHWSEEDVPAF
ncbi:two-component system regulatory protein YycI [Heyndrickxia sporothermodurans]